MSAGSELPLIRWSLVVAALAAGSSLAGLVTDVYRDNTWATAGFQGNDLVTLTVAVPILLVSIILARRGSLAGRLAWLGALAYMLYNYAFYLFGAAFNELFLAYVGLVAISGTVLLIGISHTDVEEVATRIGHPAGLRWVAGFLIGLPALLSLMWVSQVVAFLVGGAVPRSVTDSGIHTAVIFALDLGLLVPASLLAGIWLLRNRPWGYVLGCVLLIKDGAYALALIGMSFFAAEAGIADAWLLAPLWGLLGAMAIAAAVVMYKPLLGRTTASAGNGPTVKSSTAGIHA